MAIRLTKNTVAEPVEGPCFDKLSMRAFWFAACPPHPEPVEGSCFDRLVCQHWIIKRLPERGGHPAQAAEARPFDRLAGEGRP